MTIPLWKKMTHPFSLSVAAHGLMLLALILYICPTQDLQQAPALSATLVSASVPAVNVPVPLPVSPHALTTPHRLNQALSRTFHTTPTQPTANTNQHLASPLLTLLHTAIAQQQHYPASAQELEQTGRVTLSFTLFPDGSINQLTITRSSGISSLDNAALAAINAATPFQRVDRYLKAAQQYQLDVVFELA